MSSPEFVPSSPLEKSSLNEFSNEEHDVAPQPGVTDRQSPTTLDSPNELVELSRCRKRRQSSTDESDADGPTDGPTVELRPPPEAIYPSYQRALDAVHGWAEGKGYELSITRAVKNSKGQIYKRQLQCSRHGKLQNKRKLAEEDRVRLARGTRKTGCQMGMWVAAVNPKIIDGPWKTVHQNNRRSYIHNHSAAPKIVLPATRRRAQSSVRDVIRQQDSASIDVSRTLATFQTQDPDLPITRRDIYNERARARKEGLQNLTPIEGVFKTLNDEGFFHRHRLDDEGHLRDILMVSPLSIRLLHGNSDVILFDCTYKTNRYNRPVLNICATTGLNTTIHAGVALMCEEKESDYLWVLGKFRELLEEEDIDLPTVVISDRDKALMNAIESTFPGTDSLICRWHQNKDVIAYCRKHIKDQIPDPNGNGPDGNPIYIEHPDTQAFLDTFFKCVNAKTEEDFTSAVKEGEKLNGRCAKYLAREWWPWKEKCVAYWTNQITHFGQQTTSRLEGLHALMKRWLANSRSDLYTFIRKLIPLWQQHFTESMYRSESDKMIVPFSISGKVFARTAKIIYRWPLVQTSELLTKARKQLYLIKKGESERTICHNGFRTAHGRPCIHDLMDIIENDGVLLPEHFHGHWWIDRENAPAEARERILEPRVLPRQRAKRKKQTGTGPNGTRREPLYSERVDKNHPASPPRPSLPHIQNDLSTMPPGPPQASSLQHDLRFQAHTSYLHPPLAQQSGPSTTVQHALPYSPPGPELPGLSYQQPHELFRPAFHQHPSPIHHELPPATQAQPHQGQPSHIYIHNPGQQQEEGSFFRAHKPPRGWGYVPHTSFDRSNAH